MAVANSIHDEVDKIVNFLKGLSKQFDRKGQHQVLKKGAAVISKAIKAKSPKSGEDHDRYNTAKLFTQKRAKKGSGQVVATYAPGNFARSIRTMTFNKTNAVFIGPKIKKGDSTGTFSGNRVDGYYAHIVEYGASAYGTTGSAPIRRGFAESQIAALAAIRSEAAKIVTKYKNQNSQQLSLF